MTFLYLTVAKNFPKRRIGNPARIPPQTPPAGGKSAEAKRKILFPRKTDFRFAESALKSHALPESLEGRTPKEKPPFLFQEKIRPREIRSARSVFSFGVAGVLAGAWGLLRAYASVSLHHARGACEVITSLCFGNRCEFGTIQTPVVTCSELRIWSNFAQAKIALRFSPNPLPPAAEAVKSHNSPQRMETVLSLISGLERLLFLKLSHDDMRCHILQP